jgi:hypothetical protein
MFVFDQAEAHVIVAKFAKTNSRRDGDLAHSSRCLERPR